MSTVTYAPTLRGGLVRGAWARRGPISLMLMIGEAAQRSRFAYALQKAMDARDASGRGLAKEMGIDARKIAGWLSGKRLPNLYESQALAAALGVDEDLFRNPPEVPVPPPYPLEQYLLGAADQGGSQGQSRPLPDDEGPTGRGPSRRPPRKSGGR